MACHFLVVGRRGSPGKSKPNIDIPADLPPTTAPVHAVDCRPGVMLSHRRLADARRRPRRTRAEHVFLRRPLELDSVAAPRHAHSRRGADVRSRRHLFPQRPGMALANDYRRRHRSCSRQSQPVCHLVSNVYVLCFMTAAPNPSESMKRHDCFPARKQNGGAPVAI